jgi:hypothetical protein
MGGRKRRRSGSRGTRTATGRFDRARCRARRTACA